MTIVIRRREGVISKRLKGKGGWVRTCQERVWNLKLLNTAMGTSLLHARRPTDLAGRTGGRAGLLCWHVFPGINPGKATEKLDSVLDTMPPLRFVSFLPSPSFCTLWYPNRPGFLSSHKNYLFFPQIKYSLSTQLSGFPQRKEIWEINSQLGSSLECFL